MEQKINTNDVVTVKVSEIVSKDEPQKLETQLLRAIEELKEERIKISKIKKMVIAAAVIGFILGAIIG